MTNIFSFHVKILFHPTMGYLVNAGDHALETVKCIDNLISTLLYAYRELKESIESPDGPHGNFINSRLFVYSIFIQQIICLLFCGKMVMD